MVSGVHWCLSLVSASAQLDSVNEKWNPVIAVQFHFQSFAWICNDQRYK